jgi:hypothetical protein
MSGMVTARLYTADQPIDLSKAVWRGGMIRGVGRGTCAVLVIPRDQILRDPLIVLLSGRRTRVAQAPGRLLVSDTHIVSAHPVGRERRELADVLVTRGSAGRRATLGVIGNRLERYPGAEIVMGAYSSGCLAGFRDGVLAEIAGVTDRTSLSVLGSFLHCWVVAGLPLSGLESAGIALGTAGPGGGLVVVARATLGALRRPWVAA